MIRNKHLAVQCTHGILFISVTVIYLLFISIYTEYYFVLVYI